MASDKLKGTFEDEDVIIQEAIDRRKHTPSIGPLELADPSCKESLLRMKLPSSGWVEVGRILAQDLEGNWHSIGKRIEE